MSSGTHRLVPRDPRTLGWKRGPLPEPEEGMAVIVFRPHFDLRCAATVFYLMATPLEPEGDVVWGEPLERHPFEDQLTDDDWWAPLGPDALYVLAGEFQTRLGTSQG